MTHPSLALQYHRAAYTETQSLSRQRTPNATLPHGLMGREVASHQFLSALLKFGNWSRIDALLAAESDRQSLTQQCTEILKGVAQRRHVRIIPPGDRQAWISNPTSQVLHFPFPPDTEMAWKRHRQASHGFAISGVTHTLCSLPAIESLWRCLAAPFADYDRLICTSHAVHTMVSDTVAAMIERIEGTTGERVTWQMGLEVCPLGVDAQLHRPATDRERFEARRRLGIPADKLVLLFTGRLSHHSKAQPYPMFVGAQRLAEQSAQDVCLVLCGWFATPTVRLAFEATANRVAPNVRLYIVDGMDAWWRMHAWDAADIFVSLADSIQETFGLTPLEAMARGLPVIASDWNGYRDIVDHQTTGYLIRTAMVRKSNLELSEKLMNESISYDQFLASVGQTVSVSIADTCNALIALGKDPALRKRMGQAGHDRAKRLFAWPQIIARYESIWDDQRSQLDDARKRGHSTAVMVNLGNPHYPEVERCFAGYPSAWITADQHRYRPASDWKHELKALLAAPLTNHSLAWSRHFDQLDRCLENASLPISADQWMHRLASAGIEDAQVPDAFAWLLKYGLLISNTEPTKTTKRTQSEPKITFVTTCKGRLDDLKITLPITQSQPNSQVIVVDYSCPQHAGDWIELTYPAVRVVRVPGKSIFDRSDAKNAGAFAAETEWICLLDADIVLSADFVERVSPLLQPGIILRSDHIQEGTGGTFLCEKKAFVSVGGHDPVFHGWGEEDEDLVDALRFAGGSLAHYPAGLLTHIHHDESKRTLFHEEKSREISHTINRIYRSMKWDWSRVIGTVPSLAERLRLHQQIAVQVRSVLHDSSSSTIEIELGQLAWNPLRLPCQRVLQYRLRCPQAVSDSSESKNV